MLESHFKKVTGPQACNFLKKKYQHRCFPVKFERFLRARFLQNTSGGCFLRKATVTIQQSVQRVFTNIPYAQKISDHLHFNENAFTYQKRPMERFCNRLRVNSQCAEICSKYQQRSCSFSLRNNYDT